MRVRGKEGGREEAREGKSCATAHDVQSMSDEALLGKRRDWTDPPKKLNEPRLQKLPRQQAKHGLCILL